MLRQAEASAVYVHSNGSGTQLPARAMHSVNLLPLDFRGDLSTRCPLLLSLPGIKTLPSLYIEATDFPRTTFVIPRRLCFRSVRRRAFSRSFGSVSFFPPLRRTISLILFSPRALVVTEKLKLESAEPFTGMAVK